MAIFEMGHTKGGRPKGRLNRATAEVRLAGRWLVEDREYRRNLRDRLREGKAGPLEPLLWHHAYGKPTDHPEQLPAPMPVPTAVEKLASKIVALEDEAFFAALAMLTPGQATVIESDKKPDQLPALPENGSFISS